VTPLCVLSAGASDESHVDVTNTGVTCSLPNIRSGSGFEMSFSALESVETQDSLSITPDSTVAFQMIFNKQDTVYSTIVQSKQSAFQILAGVLATVVSLLSVFAAGFGFVESEVLRRLKISSGPVLAPVHIVSESEREIERGRLAKEGNGHRKVHDLSKAAAVQLTATGTAVAGGATALDVSDDPTAVDSSPQLPGQPMMDDDVRDILQKHEQRSNDSEADGDASDATAAAAVGNGIAGSSHSGHNNAAAAAAIQRLTSQLNTSQAQQLIDALHQIVRTSDHGRPVAPDPHPQPIAGEAWVGSGMSQAM
jgi:hypothetical protein